MASMNRLLGLSSLTLAAALLVACGSDSGGVNPPPIGSGAGGDANGGGGSGGGSSAGANGSGGGSNSGGGTSDGGASGNGGATGDGGSSGTDAGTGGATTTGGATGSGGTDAGTTATGGASNTGGASTGGNGNGGASAGGTSNTGGTGTGGASAGGTSNTGGASAGGTSNTGGAGTGGTAGTCGGVTCDPAATCTANKCVCPAGTTDKNGNGTKCTKPNGGTCSVNGDCTNAHCVGGTCCGVACTTPGVCQQLAGTVCVGGNTCQYGKALDGAACDDGDACTTTSCFDGTCSVDSTKTCGGTKCSTQACNPVTGNCDSTPIVCNDNNPCTTDTCDLTNGCQFTANTLPCNDNSACTTGDTCSGGTCKGTAINCNDGNVCTTDACNPASGCTHTNNTLSCNDNNACTSTDKCSNGTCTGSGNACGPIATGCTPCTSGATCFGAPNGRDCTCPATSGGTPVIEQNGMCSLNTDECASNPCGALSTGCVDPTPTAPASKDYQCTCVAGTTGNTVGTACVDKNECTSGPNPCGAGTCTNAAPPTLYTCACQAGYRSVPTATGPTCGCDMSGTYAEFVTTTISWSGVGGGVIEDSPPGGVPSYGWSLRLNTYASDGSMTVTTVPCGGVAPTLCSTTAAYAQYQPVSSWGRPRLRSGFPPIAVPATTTSKTIPGGTYAEPQIAAILGIDLADPNGAWPTCADFTTCDGSNAAVWWNDAEGTKKLGVTTFAVNPGGASYVNATTPGPPIDYTVPSECPRTGGSTGTADYSAWPGYVPLLDFYSTNTWYGGSRIISALKGTSVTFDSNVKSCVIAGNVIGPDNGGTVPHSDARIVGCEKTTGTCSTAEANFYDSAAQTQVINGSVFKLERAPATIDLAGILAETDATQMLTDIDNACETIRVKYCPPGKTCQ